MIGDSIFNSYAERLREALSMLPLEEIGQMARDFALARESGRSIWVCGNGGSGANAVHWANDFIYPVVKEGGRGIRIHALTANAAVVTCLGNDIGYERIFSRQLETCADEGDLLIVLSGSGNSPNILRAIEQGRRQKLKSYALVGFDGGKAKSLADTAIHFPVYDMQIAEDLQGVVCHMLVQCLAHAFKASA